jgi:hypothetical protein
MLHGERIRLDDPACHAHSDGKVSLERHRKRAGLPVAARLYLTVLETDKVRGDATFPPWRDTAVWVEVERTSHPADEQNPYPCQFLVYQRQNAGWLT